MFVALASLLLLVLAFIVDVYNHIGVADGFLYILPVLVSQWARSNRATYAMATLTSVMIFVGLFFHLQESIWTQVINRALAIVFVFVVAYLVVYRRELEHELRASRDRADFFIDLLTHDINNLNAVTMGYIQLAQHNSDMGERERRYLAKSLGAVKETSELIGKVQKLQMVETGQASLVPVDVDTYLNAARTVWIDSSGEDVSINLRSVSPHFVVANELLMDVITNLIGNAIKHSGRPLVINIDVSSRTERGRDYYLVSIEDNGPGISDELKEAIFTRSTRGKTKASGRGLGLFLVKKLVEDFHGRVWVEDRVPGERTKGARFMLLLPASVEKDGH